VSALADSQKSLQDQVRLLLGDGASAQFQDFQASLPDRMIFEQMKTAFGDNPLTDDQQQRLLQIMILERKNSSFVDPATGKPLLPAANPAAQVDLALQIQDQINQRVYQQAAGFLSPNQLQSLATSQSNLRSQTKAIMPGMQKMFGKDASAVPGGQ